MLLSTSPAKAIVCAARVDVSVGDVSGSGAQRVGKRYLRRASLAYSRAHRVRNRLVFIGRTTKLSGLPVDIIDARGRLRVLEILRPLT